MLKRAENIRLKYIISYIPYFSLFLSYPNHFQPFPSLFLSALSLPCFLDNWFSLLKENIWYNIFQPDIFSPFQHFSACFWSLKFFLFLRFLILRAFVSFAKIIYYKISKPKHFSLFSDLSLPCFLDNWFSLLKENIWNNIFQPDIFRSENRLKCVGLEIL